MINLIDEMKDLQEVLSLLVDEYRQLDRAKAIIRKYSDLCDDPRDLELLCRIYRDLRLVLSDMDSTISYLQL